MHELSYHHVATRDIFTFKNILLFPSFSSIFFSFGESDVINVFLSAHFWFIPIPLPLSFVLYNSQTRF